MVNNIKLSFDFTVSKIAGLYLIIVGPFIAEPTVAITIGAGLLGFKQGMDAIKAVKNNGINK
jgi:hypothetical protein